MTNKKTNKKVLKELSSLKVKNFLLLTLAGIINAFGVVIFLFPVKIYDSGISGLSMLLDQVTPPHLTLSIFLIIINLPIFLFGYKKQGIQFTLYSIYTILIYSLMSYLITNVLPINVELVSPVAGKDLLLCAIFGGIISGIGSGLTIRFGGAIDGIDVLSVVFSKKIGISIGTFILGFNIILYMICGIVIDSWILPLYSILTFYVESKTIDYIVEGISRSKCAIIITTKASEITSELSKHFDSSGTIIKAIGGYTKKDKEIIYFIINHLQINKVKIIAHSIDPKAYIILQEVSDVIKLPQE